MTLGGKNVIFHDAGDSLDAGFTFRSGIGCSIPLVKENPFSLMPELTSYMVLHQFEDRKVVCKPSVCHFYESKPQAVIRIHFRIDYAVFRFLMFIPEWVDSHRIRVMSGHACDISG